MTIQDIGLFQALGAKMNYLNQRQGIIAQNVANADTPGYRPKDLAPVDFSSMLKAQTSRHSVSVARTDDRHLSHVANGMSPKVSQQRDTYEVAPSGNAVIMEEQLLKAGQNAADYNLILNILQKQVGMMRLALGRR